MILRQIQQQHWKCGVIPEYGEEAYEVARLHYNLLTSADMLHAWEEGTDYEIGDYTRCIVNILQRKERTFFWRNQKKLNRTEKFQLSRKLLQETTDFLNEMSIHAEPNMHPSLSGEESVAPSAEKRSPLDDIYESDEDSDSEPLARFKRAKVNCNLCRGRPTTHHAVSIHCNGRLRGIPETCSILASLKMKDKLAYCLSNRICTSCTSFHKFPCQFLTRFPYFRCGSKTDYCIHRFSLCPHHIEDNIKKLTRQKQEFAEINIEWNF